MMKNRIQDILNALLDKPLITIVDESALHKGHAGNPNHATENTHLKLKIVSHRFQLMSRLARHRLVNEALSPLFDDGLHALTLDLKTPEEV